MNQITQKNNKNNETVTFLALGGEENVTRNMYLYIYKEEILIVDCGLGFPDESMLGVDFLLPDVAPLLKLVQEQKKRIVGMVLTHGHEDHIGALPFLLPQLPEFPIYATPLTAALANEKLLEYKLEPVVTTVKFEEKSKKIGIFDVSFVRITHSVPDSANIIIKTPIGNMFHGSDFKFDLTPADGRRTDFLKITQAAREGIVALFSDCLGSDREGFTPSEQPLEKNFEREMRDCQGKFIITTYSSNIARMNQAISAAQRVGRKVCFVGRSMLKVKQIGQKLGYLHIRQGTEIPLSEVGKYKGKQLLLLVAGSQGQENSAMTRIAEGEHKDIRLEPNDTVLFSSDTIPGNELSVNSLNDAIARRGAKGLHTHNNSSLFHVSGHGSSGDHMLLIALTQPKFLVPISGTYLHMDAYRLTAQKMGYKRNEIFLLENGREVIFSHNHAQFGKRHDVRPIYVDEVSGEEVDNFVIRDRERPAREGVLIIMVEIKASDGQIATKPEIIVRGAHISDIEELTNLLTNELEKMLTQKKESVTNWIHIRRIIGEAAEKQLAKKLRVRPLVLPVIIEV